MYENDMELFKAADLNGDGALDKAEFPGFSHPEEFKYMHEVRKQSLAYYPFLSFINII